MGYADLGRIPKEFEKKHGKLNVLERVLMARIATIAVIDKCRTIDDNADDDLEKHDRQLKIKGHAFFVPIESEILYNDMLKNVREYLKKIYSIAFVGDEGGWRFAQTLSKITSRVHMSVEKYVHYAWAFKHTGNSAYSNTPSLTEEEKQELDTLLKNVEEEIIQDALLADDGYSLAMDKKAGSDVARARPQEDDSDDCEPGWRNMLLTSNPVERSPEIAVVAAVRDKIREARLRLENMKEEADEDEESDEDVQHDGDQAGSMGGLNVPTKREVKVYGSPIKDFYNLPDVLSKAFPYLFPLGVTERHLGSMSKLTNRVKRRWFKFYDPRFQETPEFYFWCFSFLMRKKVVDKVKISTLGPGAKEFEDLMNSPNIEERLEEALNDMIHAQKYQRPVKRKTNELIQKIVRHVNIIGSKVPWSAMERSASLKRILAMVQSFGSPSF